MKHSWISLVGALVVLAVVAPSAQAQGGGPPPGGMRGGGMRGGGARMMELLLKDITLDAAQRAKLESIKEKYAKEMPATTPGERPDEAAMRQRRELQTKQQNEVRAILTADQQKVFDRNLAELRERMQRRG